MLLGFESRAEQKKNFLKIIKWRVGRWGVFESRAEDKIKISFVTNGQIKYYEKISVPYGISRITMS